MSDESQGWPSIPPKEVRSLCYKVGRQLLQSKPRLDTLCPRLRGEGYEAASRDILDVLSKSSEWQTEILGLIPTPPADEDREVEIELLDVMSKMLKRGHSIQDAWNCILNLIDKNLLELSLLKRVYSLTESVKRDIGTDADRVEYPTGRVVLKTDFKAFQRYLSGLDCIDKDRPASDGHPRSQGGKDIPPGLRTRPMTLGEAAGLLKILGKTKREKAKRLKAHMNDGEINFDKINRQRYVFNIEDFSPEVQGRLKR